MTTVISVFLCKISLSSLFGLFGSLYKLLLGRVVTCSFGVCLFVRFVLIVYMCVSVCVCVGVLWGRKRYESIKYRTRVMRRFKINYVTRNFKTKLLY